MVSALLSALFATALALSLGTIALSIRRYGRDMLALRRALQADASERILRWHIRRPVVQDLGLPVRVALRAPRATLRAGAMGTAVQARPARALHAAA